jgi:DNA (cytosine-5)-methyltransferase 1
VAQRRERLFAVISFGDGPDPVEVLFERQGLSRHPPSRGEAGEGFARAFDEGADVGRGPGGRSPNRRAPAQGGVPFGCDYDQAVGRPLVAAAAGNRSDIETETVVVGTPTSNGKAAGSATQQDAEQGLLIPTTYASVGHFGGMVRSEVSDPLRATGGDTGGGGEALIAHSLRGEGFDASEDGTGRGTPIVPVTYSIMPQNSGKDYKARAVDVAQPLMASGPAGGDQGGDYIVQPIAFNARQDPISGAVVGPLDTDGATHAIAFSCKDHGADAGDIAPTMRAMGHTGSHPNAGGQLAVAFSLRGRENGAQAEVEEGDVSPSLRAAEGGSTRPFVAFQQSQSGVREVKLAPTLDANMGSRRMNGIVDHEMAVRRITVVEAERLQGFRDGYTLIEWPTANRKDEELEEFTAYLISHGYSPEEAEILAQTPDGPRYRGISNSKAVPLVRKLGERYAAALRRFIDQGSA